MKDKLTKMEGEFQLALGEYFTARRRYRRLKSPKSVVAALNAQKRCDAALERLVDLETRMGFRIEEETSST